MLSLLTDNGGEFVSSKMQDTLAALNVKHMTTSLYNPCSNGSVERSHRFLLDVLSKKIQGNPETWDLYLGQATAAINFSVNESSKFSPFFLMFHRDPILPIDNLRKCRQRYHGEDACQLALEKAHEYFLAVHKNLRRSKQRNAKYKDKLAKEVTFEVGNPVYLKKHKRSSKLCSKWEPFYRIVKQRSPLTYIIRNQLDGREVETHAKHLRLANVSDWEIRPQDEIRQRRKARFVESPYESESESEGKGETPLRKLVDKKENQRAGSSSEDDIPLLELSK